MLKRDRHDIIMKQLRESGSILVSEACDLLGCSDQTIRRDLRELEERGLLKRIHGGAFIEDAIDKGAPYQLRSRLILKEKLQMAKLAAAGFISSGDVIMLDPSSTCHTLAKHLIVSEKPVTIITNSAAVVPEFTGNPGPARLICTGGRYKANTDSFEGVITLAAISSYAADKAFISCNALTRDHGMLDHYESQMEIRAAMLEHARERYLLVDHTKFDDSAEIIIGDFSCIDGIITDQEPAPEWCEYFSRLGIKVLW